MDSMMNTSISNADPSVLISGSEVMDSMMNTSISNADPSILVSHYKEKLSNSMKIILMFNKELNHIKKKNEENEIENTRLKLRIRHLEKMLSEQVTELSKADDLNVSESMNISSSQVLETAETFMEKDNMYCNSMSLDQNDSTPIISMSLNSKTTNKHCYNSSELQNKKTEHMETFMGKDDVLFYNTMKLDQKHSTPKTNLSSNIETTNNYCDISRIFQNEGTENTETCIKKENVLCCNPINQDQNDSPSRIVLSYGEDTNNFCHNSFTTQMKTMPYSPVKQMKAKKRFTNRKIIDSGRLILYQQNPKDSNCITDKLFGESNFQKIKSEPESDCESYPPTQQLGTCLNKKFSFNSGDSTEAVVDKSENDSCKKYRKKQRFKKKRISVTESISKSHQRQVTSLCNLLVKSTHENINNGKLSFEKNLNEVDISTEAFESESEQVENSFSKVRKKRKKLKRKKVSCNTTIINEKIKVEGLENDDCSETSTTASIAGEYLKNNASKNCKRKLKTKSNSVNLTTINSGELPKSNYFEESDSSIQGPQKKVKILDSETSDVSISLQKRASKSKCMEEMSHGQKSTKVSQNQSVENNMNILHKKQLRSNGTKEENVNQVSNIKNKRTKAKLKSLVKKAMNVNQVPDTKNYRNIVSERKQRNYNGKDTLLCLSDSTVANSLNNLCCSREISSPVTRSLWKKMQTNGCSSLSAKTDQIKKRNVRKKIKGSFKNNEKLSKNCSSGLIEEKKI